MNKKNIGRRFCKYFSQEKRLGRKNTLQLIQFLLQYWPLKSFKVNDFHVIWKPICDFLLMINTKLGRVYRRLRDKAT